MISWSQGKVYNMYVPPPLTSLKFKLAGKREEYIFDHTQKYVRSCFLPQKLSAHFTTSYLLSPAVIYLKISVLEMESDFLIITFVSYSYVLLIFFSVTLCIQSDYFGLQCHVTDRTTKQTLFGYIYKNLTIVIILFKGWCPINVNIARNLCNSM